MQELKTEILNITDEIIKTELEDEYPFYDIGKNSLYESLFESKESGLEEHSHFGGQESIIAYYLLAIIAFISKELGDTGIKIAKIALYTYLKENKEKLLKKYTSDKEKKALTIIEKYLKKETE